MKIELPTGKYVVAVSGGVDSMVLLDLLVAAEKHHIIVAHFDHGIRSDSGHDRQLVQQVANNKGLAFAYKEGKLGKGASEEIARNARYAFLREVLLEHAADAILTAHHQDDAIETALINIHRGTGRRGLTALASRPGLIRPLLNIPKSDILAYAKTKGLSWNEDSTNQDQSYLRNYLRHNAVKQLNPEQRQDLLNHLAHLRQINHDLDQELTNYLLVNHSIDALDRHRFKLLPDDIAREVMATWLRQNGISTFDRKTLLRLVNGVKTLTTGKQVEITSGKKLMISRNTLIIREAVS